MRVGTRSVLFGAHCFFIHPWFVALAWWRLYGFPWDPRLWVAFFIHDLGYWGKPNMDGEEGERHPLWGARFMYGLFDFPPGRIRRLCNVAWGWMGPWYWHDFVLYHSRYFAKSHGKPYSLLCPADKLAVSLEPWWLYLPRVILTGEIHEYMKLAERRVRAGEPLRVREAEDPLQYVRLRGRRQWCEDMMDYCRRWAYEHRDGRTDQWTPEGGNQALHDETGNWR